MVVALTSRTDYNDGRGCDTGDIAESSAGVANGISTERGVIIGLTTGIGDQLRAAPKQPQPNGPTQTFVRLAEAFNLACDDMVEYTRPKLQHQSQR